MNEPSTIQKLNVANLTADQETLLIPLWARAIETRRPDPILVDEKAVELVESIDYDFDLFARRGIESHNYCSRSVVFDALLRKLIDRHPSATLVEVGPGLDTRYERLDNGSLRWFELDLPEAMSVRQQFFQSSQRRTLLSSSVLESEWITAVQQSSPTQVLIVAEGVFYFLTKSQVRSLLTTIADHFPQSSIVFDCQSPIWLKYSQLRHPTDSKLLFSLWSMKEVESWDPRFTVEECVGFGDSPYYDKQFARFPLVQRLARTLVPPLSNMFRVSHVRLGGGEDR